MFLGSHSLFCFEFRIERQGRATERRSEIEKFCVALFGDPDTVQSHLRCGMILAGSFQFDCEIKEPEADGAPLAFLIDSIEQCNAIQRFVCIPVLAWRPPTGQPT